MSLIRFLRDVIAETRMLQRKMAPLSREFDA